MNTIKITKMQGCGNDFVILDYSEFEKANIEMSDLAKKLCDRNFGIGADGMIIPKIDCEDADISWYFYNSDGSTAQMCGNGMRCFAKYVYDKKLVDKTEFSVKTLAGIIKPQLLGNGLVKVNMGKPVLVPEQVPCKLTKCLEQKIIVDGKFYSVNAVSMGNPHCIMFIQDKNSDLLKLAKTVGSKFENHEIFPEKTNVEFVRINSRNEIDLRVWERGCGITLACGTGACASVVASILNNLTDGKVKVNLLGGALNVEWSGSLADTKQDVYMSGPAKYSFFADYLL